MEEKNLDSVLLDPRNPRTISEHDFKALKKSITKFGDLSGIVKNVTTGMLVGGHQRIRAFKEMPNPTIEITERLAAPNSVGTVARGFVVNGDEKFTYREVEWTDHVQHAANIAANRISGEFQVDMLAELTYELQQFDPDLAALTGQTTDEIDDLMAMVSGEPDINLKDGDKPGFQQITFTLTDEQAEIVQQAIRFIKLSKNFEDEANQNSNGNALYYVAQEFLSYTNGEADEPSQAN